MRAELISGGSSTKSGNISEPLLGQPPRPV
jgi:hypothetical protein